MSHPPLLPIPITVLYLPRHTRSLQPSNLLGKAPLTAGARWHQAQAHEMRRVWDDIGPTNTPLALSLPTDWVPPEWA
jgi:hypothetical protein